MTIAEELKEIAEKKLAERAGGRHREIRSEMLGWARDLAKNGGRKVVQNYFGDDAMTIQVAADLLKEDGFVVGFVPNNNGWGGGRITIEW